MTVFEANEGVEAVVRRTIEFTDRILSEEPSRLVAARVGLGIILASLATSTRDEALIAPLKAYVAALDHGRTNVDEHARAPLGMGLTPSRRGS